MTFFLGATFFGLYFIVVLASSVAIKPFALELASHAQQNPTEFIYWGLFLFAFLSLTIYLIRMVIKYFYLTRGKDSS